jgi:hypothetical protein
MLRILLQGLASIGPGQDSWVDAIGFKNVPRKIQVHRDLTVKLNVKY